MVVFFPHVCLAPISFASSQCVVFFLIFTYPVSSMCLIQMCILLLQLKLDRINTGPPAISFSGVLHIPDCQ